MMTKDDLTRFAVYFNDEYIGEANSFVVVKAGKSDMPVLEIAGEFQYKE